MEDPYERLKDLTRGHRVDAERMREFVLELGLSPEAQDRLLALTPGTYTGIAESLVDHLR
jgi:adenylosuccinate lyase